MAELLKGVLTNKGLSLVARAQAGTATITFTRFEIGNGDWGASPATADLQAATELKSEKATFDISKCEYVDPSTSLLTLIASNKDNEEGYYVTEVGIYATDGADEVLYAIYVMAQGKGDWFPAHNSLIPSSLVYNCHITVANAESVTIKADPAGLALEADLETTQKEVDDINKALGSADYSALASTITEGLKILQTFKATAEPITQKIEAYTKIPSAVAFNSRVDRNWDGLGALADRATDVTADFDNGTLSQKIAANDLSDYDLGMQIKKTITIDGTAYTAHIIFAHANAFCGYSHYEMVDTPNIACIVYVEGYMSKWNESNTDGGYATSVLRTAVQKVISALQTTLGSDHMIAHAVLLSTAVSSGKSSSWVWTEGSRGEALSAAQMCGVNPSGSYYDIGEAYEQLALARLVRPNQIFGNIWLWFRDVLSSWNAAILNGGGCLGDTGVGITYHVVSLILLK
jgi:hypothetical protein